MAAAKEGSGSTRRRASWHFITGEYPPQVGGVSDYCARHAEALAGRGHEVHVWAPPAKSGGPDPAGVTVHRLPDRFGPAGLVYLGEGLDALPPPRRLFVQYVANAFGSRAMNLRFCLWLSRRRENRVWVMLARERATGGRPGLLVGHFGTFHPLVTPPLFEILPLVLRRDAARRCLLIGRGGERFASELAGRAPDLADRIAITGSLPVDEVASHVRACDVMIQPYADGVTTRRGTLMASLALGVPIVTNLGPLSEPIWVGSDVLSVAADPRPASIVAAAERLLSRPETWEDRGRRGKAFYEERFSLARSLVTLELAAAGEDSALG
ncbi:MAG: glycosyltransferase family 4 protein [Acidobacteria bacterium]|nr:glycosyltransferase family 4 protein [Acidobacteriota bacterium]